MADPSFEQLADRVAGLNYFACPMCGDDDFDVPGFVNHVDRWCEVAKVIGVSRNNTDVAAALRAKA